MANPNGVEYFSQDQFRKLAKTGEHEPPTPQPEPGPSLGPQPDTRWPADDDRAVICDGVTVGKVRKRLLHYLSDVTARDVGVSFNDLTSFLNGRIALPRENLVLLARRLGLR